MVKVKKRENLNGFGYLRYKTLKQTPNSIRIYVTHENACEFIRELNRGYFSLFLLSSFG